MGRPKALLPLRGGTFLSVLADTLSIHCNPVIAVFGFDGENVASAAPPALTSVINPDYQHGMLTSLQAGLKALHEIDAPVLFTLVDHPAVASETVAALIAAGAGIAIPRFEGRRGHPVLVESGIAREFRREPATSKVRYVIDRHPDRIRYIDVNDPGICDDVDNPRLYQALLQREAGRA